MQTHKLHTNATITRWYNDAFIPRSWQKRSAFRKSTHIVSSVSEVKRTKDRTAQKKRGGAGSRHVPGGHRNNMMWKPQRAPGLPLMAGSAPRSESALQNSHVCVHILYCWPCPRRLRYLVTLCDGNMFRLLLLVEVHGRRWTNFHWHLWSGIYVRCIC